MLATPVQQAAQAKADVCLREAHAGTCAPDPARHARRSRWIPLLRTLSGSREGGPHGSGFGSRGGPQGLPGRHTDVFRRSTGSLRRGTDAALHEGRVGHLPGTVLRGSEQRSLSAPGRDRTALPWKGELASRSQYSNVTSEGPWPASTSSTQQGFGTESNASKPSRSISQRSEAA